MSIKNQNDAYRRGVILGLTLAEIMLLIIFLLLLTFMAILKNEREKYEQKLNLVTKNPSVNKIVQILEKQDPSIMEELIRANEKLPEIISMIKKDDVKEDDKESSADVIVRAIDKLKLDKQIAKQKGSMSDQQQLQQALSVEDSLKSEVDNLKGQNKSLIKQIKGTGKGVDYPSCWTDSNDKPEYIYDVYLYNNGIAIKDNKIPHRAHEQSQLPNAMVYNRVISSMTFQTQSYPLLEWSKKHDCRFYVRIFDETASDQKPSYKKHLQAVEESFYKVLM